MDKIRAISGCPDDQIMAEVCAKLEEGEVSDDELFAALDRLSPKMKRRLKEGLKNKISTTQKEPESP